MWLGSSNRIKEIKDFRTPYSDIPEKTSGVVRLKKNTYPGGLYRMEGVAGFEYFGLRKPLKVTSLQVKQPSGEWITLMVDDPLHWHGMGEISRLVKPGRVLVAGLGLGLILYRLAERSDINAITIVEIDPEVIKFILPLLPVIRGLSVEQDNYFSYILNNSLEDYSSVVIDLWVLSQKSTVRERRWVMENMLISYYLTKSLMPGAEVLIWGMRNYKPQEFVNGGRKDEKLV